MMHSKYIIFLQNKQCGYTKVIKEPISVRLFCNVSMMYITTAELAINEP